MARGIAYPVRDFYTCFPLRLTKCSPTNLSTGSSVSNETNPNPDEPRVKNTNLTLKNVRIQEYSCTQTYLRIFFQSQSFQQVGGTRTEAQNRITIHTPTSCEIQPKTLKYNSLHSAVESCGKPGGTIPDISRYHVLWERL